MNICFDAMFNRVLNQFKAYHNWSVACAIWVFPAREHFPADVLCGCNRTRFLQVALVYGNRHKAKPR
jgi:hypothetical protein